jgi:2-polyprenyl-3-methyl-5-hydroxy-6-metoxy-1,4-benzoquinol methylase
LRRSANSPELLDGPLDDLVELAANLRDLRRVNRLLFGSRLSIGAIRAVGVAARGTPDEERTLRILDVGTGSADVPLALLDDARRRHGAMEVVAVDSRPEVLDAARRLDPALDRTPGLTLRVSDGRLLPFEDDAFDVAHTSLVIHHLEPDEAVALLVEMRRVAAAVVVNDVVRSWRVWLGAWVLARVGTRNRLSRNDAPLSARRAYTEPELSRLLSAAGLTPVLRRRDPLRYRIAIAATRAPSATG